MIKGYISESPFHGISDVANLIVQAHKSKTPKGSHLYLHHFCDNYYQLEEKSVLSFYNWISKASLVKNNSFDGSYHALDAISNSYYRDKISGAKLVDLFYKNALNATCCDDHPQEAVALLKQRFRAHYYSGICGWIGEALNRLMGWFAFEKTDICQKLDKISQIISKLPKTKQDHTIQLLENVKKIEGSFHKEVFTDNLRDDQAIGWLCGYANTRKYNVKWMSPESYLKQVDPHFQRHPDEKNLPWILNQMAALAKGIGTQKFAPLMMDPQQESRITDNYTILGHEGRHRALAASLLKISSIPVAIQC